MTDHDALVVFQDKKIRRIWLENEWYFSVVDVVEILTESPTPRQYWGKVKEREFIALELSPIWVQLKLQSEDGKLRETDCANTKNMFRIIQSIPSPKAEPFKQWLAKVGYERVEEIQNPELAQARMKEIYKEKGYSDEWIEKRVRGIAVRQELTDEWNKRGVKEDKEYAILTNEISKAAFGKTVEEYKKHKGLQKENLRDHMTDLELIFNMLGEASTTEIARKRQAQGFNENKVAARKGGTIAGDARRKLEIESGATITSPENYLAEPEKEKRSRLTKKSASPHTTNNRAQISMFILVGMIMIFLFAALFFGLKGIQFSSAEKTLTPEGFVQDCLRLSAQKSLQILGRYSAVPSSLAPPSPKLPAVREWCVSAACKEKAITLDALNTTEQKLQSLINSEFKSCLGDFAAIKKQGWQVITPTQISSKITFTPEKMIVETRYPLEFKKGSTTTPIGPLYLSMESEYRGILALANQTAESYTKTEEILLEPWNKQSKTVLITAEDTAVIAVAVDDSSNLYSPVNYTFVLS